MDRSDVAFIEFVEFENAVVIAWSLRIEIIDQPQPASALSKEEFALIFIIPLSPLLGIVVTEQRIAIEDALCLLYVFAFFPHGDSFVKDTLVVIGDADALGIFIELNIIIVQIAIEIWAIFGIIA